jgi:hypothetical protein
VKGEYQLNKILKLQSPFGESGALLTERFWLEIDGKDADYGVVSSRLVDA